MKTSNFSGIRWALAVAMFVGLFCCAGQAQAQAVYVAAPRVVVPAAGYYYGAPRPAWGYAPRYYRPYYGGYYGARWGYGRPGYWGRPGFRGGWRR